LGFSVELAARTQTPRLVFEGYEKLLDGWFLGSLRPIKAFHGHRLFAGLILEAFIASSLLPGIFSLKFTLSPFIP
jgi:hypothetical protein